MNQASVVVRGMARRDIQTRYDWFLREADREVADRFLAATDAAFRALAETPKMGPGVDLPHPRLAAMRKWRVDGFRDVLIFYEPRPGGVSVARVLHAAQDWRAVIGETA